MVSHICMNCFGRGYFFTKELFPRQVVCEACKGKGYILPPVGWLA